MSLTDRIIHFWHNLKINTKFALGVLLLLLLVVLVSLTGYLSLNSIRQVEREITKGRDVQRLVLAMDGKREKAQRLHRDFFLQYPRIGLSEAHAMYMQPSIREISQVIALSKKLKGYLVSPETGWKITDHHVDLNLYLSSAKRFAATSIESVELVTELVVPERGLETQLNGYLEELQIRIDAMPDPRGLDGLFRQMKFFALEYRLTRLRHQMQSSFNMAMAMEDEIDKDGILDPQWTEEVLDLLDRYQLTAERILAIDVLIKGKFRDFALQDRMIAPVSEVLVELAEQEVRTGQDKIAHAYRIAFIMIVSISLTAMFCTLWVAWVLHRSITSRVVKLRETVKQYHHEQHTSPFVRESRDELGDLMEVFRSMAGRMADDILRLEKAEFELSRSHQLLEKEVKKRTSELEKLLVFSQHLSGTRELRPLFRKCTELAKELLDFDFSTLMLLTPDRKSLVVQDTIGFPESMIGSFALLEGQGLSTYVVREKKPAMVLDFRTERRFEVPPVVFEMGITSSLCVPMMIGNDVFGVFIGHTRNQRIFTQSEISLYQSFANQAAVAIDNGRHVHHLFESEKKFRTFFDNANDSILIYDLNGSLLEVNKVACDRLGYSRNELLSLPASEFIAVRFLKYLPDRIRRVTETGKQIFESAHIRRNGEEIPIELSCTAITYREQQAILGIARDITDRKKMEKEILKVKKLESVGLLAGGIAHDFNNILSAILGNVNLALLDGRLSEETKALLAEAEKASVRAKGLTGQLLTFAKGGEPIKEVASVEEVIRDSAEFVLRGGNVSCAYRMADDLWSVEIDKGQISQVIQNLIINGRQAMPEGGIIEIRCSNYSCTAQVGQEEMLPGKYVKISITDHGRGIPEEVIDKIFDPYYTTKPEGSGLGLAVCHSIVSKHGGVISVSSRPAETTTFTIYLPSTGESGVEPVRPEVSDAVQVGVQGRILIMDDDAMVRNVATAICCHLGYEVLLAEDGAEAVKQYHNRMGSDAPIDIVIMDLTVPGGMGGREAVGELIRMDPDARVIVASGYSNDPVMSSYRDFGFKAAIVKPFNLAELAAILKKIEKP